MDSIEDHPSGRWSWLWSAEDGTAVGTRDGPEEFTLGEILDADVSFTDELAILDQSFGSVRIFDRSGMPAQVLGGFGEGPGEFEDPIAISFGPLDTLLVADRGVLIHKFGRTGDTLVFSNRIRLKGIVPQDACSAGGDLFVLGERYVAEAGSGDWSPSFLGSVHKVSDQGEVEKSFSVPYLTEDPLEFQRFSVGVLACDAPNGRVWIGYGPLGEIHAYGADGDLLWISKLEGFRHSLFKDERGGIVPDMSADRVDMLRSIFYLSPEALVATVESWTFEETGLELDTEARIIVINPDTGEVRAAGAGWNLLGGSALSAVAVRNAPFPQFVPLAASGMGGR